MNTLKTSDKNYGKASFSTVELVRVALFVGLMAVCSWISIPAPPPMVPFTMQTFGVFTALLFLGGKDGFFAILVYLLLGAVGLPVFSGFAGGVGVLFGTTGGYLLGFLLTALLYWVMEHIFRSKFYMESNFKREKILKFLTLLAGLLVCYAFGTAWFIFVYTKKTGAIGVSTALLWCVVPFIVPDLLKLSLATAVSHTLKKALGRRHKGS